MPSDRRAFTLIELMAVVLILSILAGVALPKFFDYQTTARESACKGSLGGIRAGISNFYANEAVVNGAAAYPTLAQLTTIGSVMTEILPDNPYGGTTPNGVAVASKANADARNIILSSADGWAYFEGTGGDAAIFYANTDTDDGIIDEHDF